MSIIYYQVQPDYRNNSYLSNSVYVFVTNCHEKKRLFGEKKRIESSPIKNQ